MHAVAVLFALLLIFPAQGVFCFFRNVSFSAPEQCGPFTVEFSDSSSMPLMPLSLTVVPISATPISIQLPEDSYDIFTDSGTARITFLPFSSGTKFIASLDDASGASVGLVSDVLAIQESNSTACLGPNQKDFPFYFVRGGLTQCSQFNVTFNPSIIKNPPAVRAFLPRSFSFPINATSAPATTMPFNPHPSFNDKDKAGGDDDKGKNRRKGGSGNSGNDKSGNSGDDKDSDKNDNDGGNGSDGGSSNSGSDSNSDNSGSGNDGGSSNSGSDSNNDNGGSGDGNPFNNSSDNNPSPHGNFTISSKEYLLSIMHGFQAVLTFDDGEGHRGSSNLFTAGGTSSSPSNCFKEGFHVPSSDGSSSSSPRDTRELSRGGKIAISVLGVLVGIFLIAILTVLCRRRRKVRKDLEQTSFVFTEDVDMGSSFVTTFASRVRARISQMTNGKRTIRSYRSYRDEKDGASTWIPTSPIGSPAPLGSPANDKQVSWVDFSTAFGNVPQRGSETSSAHRSRTSRADYSRKSAALPPLPDPDSFLQLTKPDVPAPTVSRSSESTRSLLDSGYLSSRSSGMALMPRRSQSARLVSRFSSPTRALISSSKRHSSAAILSSKFSLSGYGTSGSSNTISDRGPGSDRLNQIFVSSPIRPTPDVPGSISFSQTEPELVQDPPAACTRDVVRDSRYSLLKGNLRRDGPPRERGRILPFPIVSLRMSRSNPG